MKAQRILSAVLWLLTAAALTAVWAAGGGALWLGAAAAVLLLPAVSLLLNLAVRPGVRLSLTVPPTVPKGAAAQAVLTVKNTALLGARAAVRVRVRNALTLEESETALFCTVPPHGSVPLRFLVHSAHCGQLTATAEKAILFDVCGFLSVPVRTEMPSVRTTVLPELFAPEIDLAIASATPEESESYAPDRRGNDLAEIFTLREYAPGDDLRRIHWKLTAKADRLIVREASLPLQRSLLVFWDKTASGGIPPKAADALAESVSSVCRSLSEAGFAYTLGWSGEGQNVMEEADDTDRLLALLPRMVRSAGTGESGTALLAERETECFYGRVLLFSHTVPPKIEALSEQCDLTLFLCSDDGEAAPCRTVRFTPEDYAQKLQNLEFME